MSRVVLPELLDVLPPQDSAALRSRNDLRRLNAWMRHPTIMAEALNSIASDSGHREMVELGAGDGHFLLSVAARLNGQWRGTNAVLVDRLRVTDPHVRPRFNELDWQVHEEVQEAATWLRQATPMPSRTIVCNLFLHQFQTDQLTEMLRLAADSAGAMIALEPRRSWLPKLCGRLIWLIGCGPVTRHDAHISIRAGFVGPELSALWPDKENWLLTERPVGMFSHLFMARRRH